MTRAADEIYRSYIMRNIAPSFPACMFIPIIASRRPMSLIPPESCRNLDQSRCRNVQAGSRSNPSCRTDGQTYEISSPGCSSIPIVFNIRLFFRRESGRAGERERKRARFGQDIPGKKAGFVATDGSYLRFIRGLPPRKSGQI